MARMRFFYVLVMGKRLIFEELFEYMFGDKPLDKNVYVNENSLNGLNLCIKKNFMTVYILINN